ncbi:AzlD domain-containing protein [Patulibacter defluvii]|uniref:AzlD domain-containing protein n=1 Tax=Patulibacter defluvii TaxID=3095358 RepID=UPI002A74D546|nr:AzlD domain-containing protein [Patulibacter sp. DM4]
MRIDVVALLVVTAIAALLPRAVGPVLLGGRPLPAPLRRTLELLAPALLTALIVVGIWGGADGGGSPARAAGVAAGIVVVLRRGPLVVAMIVAATVAAGLRLAT